MAICPPILKFSLCPILNIVLQSHIENSFTISHHLHLSHDSNPTVDTTVDPGCQLRE